MMTSDSIHHCLRLILHTKHSIPALRVSLDVSVQILRKKICMSWLTDKNFSLTRSYSKYPAGRCKASSLCQGRLPNQDGVTQPHGRNKDLSYSPKYKVHRVASKSWLPHRNNNGSDPESGNRQEIKKAPRQVKNWML